MRTITLAILFFGLLLLGGCIDVTIEKGHGPRLPAMLPVDQV